MYEAYRRMYSAMGVQNIEQLLPPPPQPMPTDPASENALLIKGNLVKHFLDKIMMHTSMCISH